MEEKTKEARRILEESIEAGASLRTIERLYVRFMLAKHGDNKLHTANALDIDRRTIQRWAKLGDAARSKFSPREAT